jgi:hypothetical protein
VDEEAVDRWEAELVRAVREMKEGLAAVRFMAPELFGAKERRLADNLERTIREWERERAADQANAPSGPPSDQSMSEGRQGSS